MSAPTLSIIIVNWNVRELLRACLASVMAAEGADGWQVIVVDNASADDSAAMVRSDFPVAELIEAGANLGFVGGCERGWARARAPFVLLLNPDTEVSPRALAAMLGRFAADPRLGALGATLRHPGGAFQRATGGAFPTLANLATNYLLLGLLLPHRWRPRATYLEAPPVGLRPIDWVSGAAMMLRRAAVGERLFDPDIFMFGEDMELCDRLARAGWHVRVDGDAQVVHHHGQSFAQANAADVLGSVYKGPRLFFRRKRSTAALVGYDAILFAGYAWRWPAYALAARMRPGRGYGELARFSRRYLGIMARDRIAAGRGGR